VSSRLNSIWIDVNPDNLKLDGRCAKPLDGRNQKPAITTCRVNEPQPPTRRRGSGQTGNRINDQRNQVVRRVPSALQLSPWSDLIRATLVDQVLPDLIAIIPARHQRRLRQVRGRCLESTA
jgi:hypothetical protein